MKIKALLGVSTLLMLAALYMVFIFVPTDAETGVIQRIFYFHVPLAWIAFLAFLVVFIASILYLWKRNNKWDFIASSSAEIGLIFTTLFLVTGSIIGFIDVPIVALAITLWRTQHPGPIIFEGGLSPEMMGTLFVCLAAFTTLYFLLLAHRVSMKKDEDEVKRLKGLLRR